jgi:hypothetical protein
MMRIGRVVRHLSHKIAQRCGYETVFVEIANLADPQAFERIRMWVRQQEKMMRYSTSVAQAATRLKASAYALDHPGMLDEDFKDFNSLYSNGELEISPPHELPKPELEDTSKDIL